MRPALLARKSFSRRAFVVGGAQLLTAVVLSARLFQLQLREGGNYRTLAEQNRLQMLFLSPPRGRMLDRNDQVIAENRSQYLLCLNRFLEREAQQAMPALYRLLPGRTAEIEKGLTHRKRSQDAALLVLAEHLTWEEVARLEGNHTQLPGLQVVEGFTRYYPFADTLSHVTGYVGKASEEEARDHLIYRRLPDLMIGKAGVEKSQQRQLLGVAGVKQLEVNARGATVRELTTRPPVTGDTLHLALDARIQHALAASLQGQSGSIVALDVRTGEVLVALTTPGFDPNLFSRGIPHSVWKALNADPLHPLVQKAVSGQYPPGSTFKMAVALAGLEAGVVTPDSRVHCPGQFFLGNHRFRCWKHSGHGVVSLTQALAQSCDVYFYHLGLKLGIDPIARMARRLGLDAKTGMELPGEKSGLIPDTHWKQAQGGRWSAGATVNASIGQGYVLTTPAQLAVMAARLATGRAVTPTLFRRESPVVFPSLGLEPEHLHAVQEGMAAVVNHPRGTAFARRIEDPSHAFAGKTGTSQVRRLVHYANPDLIPWDHRDHALFVGYAPLLNPQFAVSVLVEHGGSGSHTAAPLARQALLALQERYG